ncbi:O-methyltransferase [Streptomyces sp. NPDC000345]|uniref:O-methyltransferase n=1 Tax=Streptomyces sp. NPDC000345 TaxID=3364537 RepID=UPI0036B0EAEC
MDDTPSRFPTALPGLRARTRASGFTMSCEDRTGSLLAVLAAARPGGRILELGTGTGQGTSWRLGGMSGDTRLVTVELDPALQAVAREELGADERVTVVEGTAAPGWSSTPASPSTSCSRTPGREGSPISTGRWTWWLPAGPI